MNTITSMQPDYKTVDWDIYSRFHASVYTFFQREMHLDVKQHLYGDVIDFGCGSAKIAPLLIDDENISSYIGVDMSKEMVSIAQKVIDAAPCENFSILESRIEDVQGTFSSAVSMHSYYTWPDPQLVLNHIASVLEPGGTFVLVTPSPKMDMEALLKETDKELSAHPDYGVFRELNIQFANTQGARFVTMDQLIHQAHMAGFKISECHQHHYLGGINFLVLIKDNPIKTLG